MAQGEAKGRVAALMAVLEARRLHVSNEARDRILACTDSERLDAWTRAAVSVTSVGKFQWGQPVVASTQLRGGQCSLCHLVGVEGGGSKAIGSRTRRR